MKSNYLVLVFGFFLLFSWGCRKSAEEKAEEAGRASAQGQVYVGPNVKTRSLELPRAIEVATPTRLVVAIHIDEHGTVIEDSIVQSSGDSVIDKHALETVALNVFEPATRGGKPVDVWMNIPMKYHSKDSADSCLHFKGK